MIQFKKERPPARLAMARRLFWLATFFDWPSWRIFRLLVKAELAACRPGDSDARFRCFLRARREIHDFLADHNPWLLDREYVLGELEQLQIKAFS